MTGYESLGRVVAVSEGVTQVAVGDQVVATYGHRTAACVRADGLMRVPDGAPDEIALLAVLANDAAKGVGKLKLEPDDAMLITGAGTVGLLTLHWLRWLAVRRVDVLEPLTEQECRPQIGSCLGRYICR